MAPSDSDLEPDEARRQLYGLMRQDIGFRERADRALDLGKTYLGVENGHLTRISPIAGYWEAIASTDSPEGSFPAGLSLDLEKTYCRRTISRGETIALHDAPEQGWDDDPAFETHGLHCYHGVPVVAGDETYGTACFVSEAPRERPFSRDESMFAELIGHLLGHAIERERRNAELAEREQVVDVLGRVLRHNLRNDLNVIRGHAEVVRDRFLDDGVSGIETILETVDDLVELSDGTRELSTVIRVPFESRELDVTAVSRRVVTEVEDAYPDASISLEATTDARVHATPRLKIAIRELLVNAAEHAGESPSVDVSVWNAQGSMRVRVADDGPGIPKQEQAVIRQGDETPLRHGTGLGLWLVRLIVDHHDGSIETTVSESGTAVTLVIPHGPREVPMDCSQSVGSEV